MHRSHRQITLLVLLLVSCCQIAPLVAEFVEHISYDAFVSHLGKRPFLLFLTVNWCDHCRALTSEIRALAKAVSSQPAVIVARADADQQPAIAQTLRVTGFPSILFFPSQFDLQNPSHSPAEFSDWRWAEIIAEFVNNQTASQTISIQSRQSFLRWRNKHPYNLGSRATSRPEADLTPHEREAVYDDGVGKSGIREPTPLTSHNFDSLVYARPSTRFIVLFYDDHDPFVSHVIRQWRQASSAFTAADNVTISLANVSEDQSLLTRFHLQDTPSCLYFPACDVNDLPRCKTPIPCHDDLDDTENIIQFISDRVMFELGMVPDDDAQVHSYSLTEEEYQAMKERGVIFANDQEHQEHVHQMYENHRVATLVDLGTKEEL
ncbi:Protein disulfide-isomerase like 2-1 [Gracilariopsis chorda]|uniref:Protein disulfide-isomerase like 2-1 n=1 Tax=Gracilariopsis chorda TaxID=448386 RepID=A0A2V3IZ95_9FLOR|nr:Protein disulfide-isomerase like 2-1 [Gracilariopsis chorda]|eukprot:PXF47451.1 Protein disulfide-isomerase like 2-1 [Gracilariopsis chorda]